MITLNPDDDMALANAELITIPFKYIVNLRLPEW